LIALGAALAVIVPLALPGLANLAGSNFNAGDGNLVVNGTETDWANVGLDCTSTPKVGCDIDKPTGSNDDSFGQGTSENDAVPTVTDGSIPNNKSDLMRFYIANESVGGNSFVYLAWERVQQPNGTTNMDFEFNQSTQLSSNGVTPARTAGDVLISYDLSKGGTSPTLSYRTWQASGSWSATHSLSGSFEGSVNTVSVTDPINPGAPRSLDPFTFGEAAINLTTSGILPAGSCSGFGRAYLKSRSSDSFSSEIKDFIAPIPVSINNCGTLNIHKTGVGGAALQGAGFTLYNNNIPLTAPRGNEDTATSFTCTTDATGNCSMAGINVGNYWLVETTVPAGYLTLADQAVSITTGGQVVNLTLSNNPAPGTINIHKQDDDSPASPLQGAVFSLFTDASPFGPASPGGGTQTSHGAEDTAVSGKTCQTDAGGDCSITNVPLGRYWVVETTTPSGYDTAADQNVVIGLGSSPNTGQTVSLTFTDPRNFKIIVIVCKEATNTLYPSAVTIDGTSAGNSIGSAPTGTTEAAICGITSGARGGRHFGSHASNPIVIPQ